VEIRKQKIVENVDDTKDPNNVLKLKEDALLNEYSKIKILEKQEQTILKNLHDEIKSIKSMVDAQERKRAKDFEFWHEIMIKKYEWENKNGKLDSYLNSNNESDNKMLNNFTTINTNQSLNSTNLQSDSISQIAERIKNQKDLMMSQISKK
jgi:hypothetical protein